MNETIIHRRELVARIRGQNVVGLSLLLAAAKIRVGSANNKFYSAPVSRRGFFFTAHDHRPSGAGQAANRLKPMSRR
jgi:hypothetical protein